MNRVKYIRTNDDKIIVFSELQEHREFKSFNPVSAGFIVFNSEDDKPTCACFGESISLRLKSDPEKDTMLATWQILGFSPYYL